MLNAGDFVESGFGIGLLINKYKGHPDSFFGKDTIVGDILYDNMIIRQNEISHLDAYPSNRVDSKTKEELVIGVFERVVHR